MPKSFGGLLTMTLGAVIGTAIGVAILSRTPLWRFIVGAPRA